MKIKMLKTMAGPDGCGPGAILEVPREEGIALIESESALILEDEIFETADSSEEIETTEAPQARRRGRPAKGDR
jgi:hypothetical protein